MLIDILVLAVSAISLYTDLSRRKIYNSVLAPAVFIALGYHLHTGGLAGVKFSLSGLGLGLALLFIPYCTGGMGAGDVKLLGTIGSLKGPVFAFYAFLAGALAGGIIALFCLYKNKKLFQALVKIFSHIPLPIIVLLKLRSNTEFETGENEEFNISIPYGAAIVTGTLVAYFVR
ncbi:MAG TPA: prepilin peptidase [Bacillota bacterium]|nr:prepilin peptidase [Bacillota bacterium]